MNPLKTGVCDMDGVKVPEEKKGGVVSDWKDEAAFEKLFREWYAPLCGYAESLLHDRDASEDAVQGVFCTLWEKRTVLRVEESVKSYLYRAVYNAAINMLEHEKVKAAFARFLHEREEAGENNTEHYFSEEARTAVVAEINRAIDALPGQCREILLLSRFSGKKSAEIAEMLHISVRTVEAQLYRAMKRLKQDLAHLRNQEILLFLAWMSR